MKYKLENLQINLKAQNENETKQIETVRQRQTERQTEREEQNKQQKGKAQSKWQQSRARERGTRERGW